MASMRTFVLLEPVHRASRMLKMAPSPRLSEEVLTIELSWSPMTLNASFGIKRDMVSI